MFKKKTQCLCLYVCYSGDAAPGCSAHEDGCDGSTGIKLKKKTEKLKIKKSHLKSKNECELFHFFFSNLISPFFWFHFILYIMLSLMHFSWFV